MTNFRLEKMDQIDLKHTLIKGRLIFKNKSLTILDISSFAIILAGIGYIISLNFSLNVGVERALVWASIILTSSGASILRWNYAMRIKTITTNQTKKENRRLIERYIDGKGFVYRFRNDNHIQCFSEHGILWLKMDFNFIIRDREIHLNAYYWDAKLTIPSIWRIDKSIRDLNEALKNTGPKPTA